MNRRNWLKNFTLGAAGLAAFVTGNNLLQAQQQGRRQRPEGQGPRQGGEGGGPREGGGQGRGRRPLTKYPNEHFYKNGKFDEATAKEAYRELFRYHNYAIGEAVLGSPDFWILEFGQNDFSNVGMGGIFFINDKEHGYFGHDIFLLPGQMIAQHYHLPAEDKAAKHETWHVRNGGVWTVALGGDKSELPFELPKSQEEYTTCFDAKELKVGDIDILRNLEEPHFMMAGPEGAIVTEYASYHSGDGLRFSNPTVR